MIKLKDLLFETAKLTPYQIFSPGTGGKGMGNFKFDPSRIPKGKLDVSSVVQYGGDCHNKPRGVFWTSSYREKTKDTAWSDFKKNRFPDWRTGMGAVFELKSGVKILKIRSHSDYMKIQKKFPLDVSNKCGAGDMYMDWGKLSKKYDGFQLAGSTDLIPMLGQWDVESTAWFNMRKLKFVGTTKV